MQLFTIIVRGGVGDLRLDLGNPCLDVSLGASTVDDRGGFLVDANPLGAAEHLQGHVFQLDAEFFRDQLTRGQDRDILEHGLAAIAEARRLDRRDLQAAAQFIDDERCQGLALDVLGDDDQGFAGLHHRFKNREQGLQRRQLLLMDENVGVFELGDHLLGIGDEIGREIAAVELHAFDDVELGLEALCLLDRDDALVADLLHRRRDHFADRLVAIGRNRADLGDLVVRCDLFRIRLEIGDDGVDGEIDAALQIHRIETGGNRLGAFPDDRGGKNGRRGGSVAGRVILLGSDFANQLGAEILEFVGEFDLFCDRRHRPW